jgi:hypothetical protein
MEFKDIDVMEKELRDPVKQKQYVGHGTHYAKVMKAIRAVNKA